MRPFSVGLVGIGDEVVPEYVVQALRSAGITFSRHECTSGEELVRAIADVDLAWVWGSRMITAERLRLLRKCGAILRTGSGTDNVPVAEATQDNIIVCNTPLAVAEEVSDHAIALLLTIVRQTVAQNAAMRQGLWERRLESHRWHLRGSTLGLIGFGYIAQLTARKMSSFEVRILVHDPFIPQERITAKGYQAVGFEEVLRQSDFLSLHCPLLDSTHHLINERALKMMKPHAIIINTSRGPVIDEKALIRALQAGSIGAAGLDVFEEEPIRGDNPLLRMENVVVSPHSASACDIFYDKFWSHSIETILALADGYWPRSPLNRKGLTPRWPLRDREWSEEPRSYAK